MMTWVGAAIASTSFVGVVAITVVLLFAYARRIGAEEAMLVEKLGSTYVDYQRSSWRLVPFVF
jgi:protein-S-isoprenylcysteine O-methyltransferase Ste14